MRILGLTGGIASGKSTVRRFLCELGATVLDADALYHELLEPQDGQPSALARAVADRFPGILLPTGELDRRALAARVFGAPDERTALEAITHPAVGAAFAARAREAEDRGVSTLIYDVPLLFERGLERGMEGVLVVWVPRETQLARLMQRDGIASDAALQRMASQLPLDDKRGRATWVIDNSGELAETRQQVERWWREVS